VSKNRPRDIIVFYSRRRSSRRYIRRYIRRYKRRSPVNINMGARIAETLFVRPGELLGRLWQGLQQSRTGGNFDNDFDIFEYATNHARDARWGQSPIEKPQHEKLGFGESTSQRFGRQ
jgi:hypothetical protein